MKLRRVHVHASACLAHLRAGLEQHLGDFGMVTAQRLTKRRVAKSVFAVDVDALGYQELHNLRLALCGGDKDRAALVVVADVEVVGEAALRDLVQVAACRRLQDFRHYLRGWSQISFVASHGETRAQG